MTAMQERAIEMIRHMPDEKISHVVSILQGIEGLYSSKGHLEDSDLQNAYKSFKSFRKEIEMDLDYKQELANAWEEKYENIGRH